MNRWWGFIRSLVLYYNPFRRSSWTRFYRQLLTPGDCAIDVGAHVGTRALAMRRAGARVVALEPQKPFVDFLRITLPRDITLIEAAAGSAESIADMAISSRHPTVSSLHPGFIEGASQAPGFEQVRWDRSQRVHIVTLDTVIAEHGMPRYIKIDVEGFELEVLAGLSQPVEIISVEFLPGFPELSDQVINRLVELGRYVFNPVVGESAHLLWPEWQGAEATKAWLRTLHPASRSGDLFARLNG